MYDRVRKNPGIVNKKEISESPGPFLSFLGVDGLSQNDKRLDFARNAADFLIEKGIDAFQLAAKNQNDAVRIREDMELPPESATRGRKRLTCSIRDMYVLDVWPI